MSTTASITERAMLVTINIKNWGASREDRKISEEVARNHGAESSVGRYVKKLIDSKQYKELSTLRGLSGSIRDLFYKHTLPWNDDGMRILPSAKYLDFMKDLADLKGKFEAAADDFVSAYPEIKLKGEAALNGLNNPADWPDPEVLRRKFKVTLKVMPLPGADDFRISIGAAEEEMIKKQYANQLNDQLKKALVDVFTRLKTCVSDMTERVGSYETDDSGKVVKSFRDSAVLNLHELLNEVPKLNITNDPLLSEVAASIRNTLCAASGEELRNNSVLRKTVVDNGKAAVQILSQMEEYFGGIDD